MFLLHPHVKVSIVGSLRDREVACSASDRQGSNFEFCVWRTVSSQSSHHPQEVLLAQFSLYVHKGGLKPDSFHFISEHVPNNEATMTKISFLMFLYLGGALQGTFANINNNTRTENTYHKYTITFRVVTLIFKDLSTFRHFESDFLK